jgi:Double zinc ribbon
MFCPKCGAGNSESNRFCLGCGTPLSAPSSPTPAAIETSLAPEVEKQLVSEPEGKICPACGRNYSANLRFCEEDGTILVTASQAAASQSVELVEDEDAADETEAEVPVEVISSDVDMDNNSSVPETPPPDEELDIYDAGSGIAEGLACPTCGNTFVSGVRFCERDGTPLTAAGPLLALAPEPGQALQNVQPLVAETNNSYEPSEGYGSGRRITLPGVLGILLPILLLGGGYAYMSGRLDNWIGHKTERQSVGQSGKEAQDAAAKAQQPPGLLGGYKAHLADQDIVLSITGDKPKPLHTMAGVINYANVLNGGTCTAALVANTVSGVGGDSGNVVTFMQMPVVGRPTCPQDIPVKIDITNQPVSADGAVTAIRVEWSAADSGKVLMSGTLVGTSQ